MNKDKFDKYRYYCPSYMSYDNYCGAKSTAAVGYVYCEKDTCPILFWIEKMIVEGEKK